MALVLQPLVEVLVLLLVLLLVVFLNQEAALVLLLEDWEEALALREH